MCVKVPMDITIEQCDTVMLILFAIGNRYVTFRGAQLKNNRVQRN